MLKLTKDHLQPLRELLGVSAKQDQFALSRASIFALKYPGLANRLPLKSRAIEHNKYGQKFAELHLVHTAGFTLPDGSRLSFFSSPKQRIESEFAEAEKEHRDATKHLEKVEVNLTKQCDDALFEAGVCLERRDTKGLRDWATKAHNHESFLIQRRAELRSQVRSAAERVERTRAWLELMRKGVAHRLLTISPTGPAAADDLITGSEDLVVSLTDCDWNRIARLEHLPLNFLPYVVPTEIPSIADWAARRFEPIEGDAPASMGVPASELHAMYLREHGLNPAQCNQTRFGIDMKAAGWLKKDHATGNRYMLRAKLSEAEREAQLRAQFEAERAAKERAEFEQWKASRAAARVGG